MQKYLSFNDSETSTKLKKQIVLFLSMLKGTTQTFDLTNGQPCFHFNKNMTISTLDSFKRRIMTDFEEGDIKNISNMLYKLSSTNSYIFFIFIFDFFD